MFSKLFNPMDVSPNLVPNNIINGLQLKGKDNTIIDASISALNSIDNSVINEIYKIISNLQGVHLGNLGTLKEGSLENIKELIDLFEASNSRHIVLSSVLNLDAKKLKGIICTNKLAKDYQNNSSKLVFAGIQRHLNSYDFEKNKNVPTILGLGSLSGKVNTLEPYIRDSDYLLIDLNVIKSSEINNPEGSPVGFSILEICQIAKYAGLSFQNKYLNITFPAITHLSQAKAIALIVWYYLEGVSLCKQDKLDITNSTSYIVNSKSLDIELEFVKNNTSNRWWLKHPSITNSFIPCLYEDYLSICDEGTSDRILHLLERV